MNNRHSLAGSLVSEIDTKGRIEPSDLSSQVPRLAGEHDGRIVEGGTDMGRARWGGRAGDDWDESNR